MFTSKIEEVCWTNHPSFLTFYLKSIQGFKREIIIIIWY